MLRSKSADVRARFAVLGIFWICGLLCAVWSASLPTLNARLGLGEGRLGLVLLLTALGSMTCMPLAGRLSDAWSSRNALRAIAPLAALALLGPALAPSFPVLLAAAFVLGAALGSLDVVMNTQAAEIENRYGRPIMSSFHGVWSLGGVAGGLTISAGLSLGADGTALTAGVAVVAAGLFLLPGKRLLADRPRPRKADVPAAAQSGLPTMAVLLLGMVAMAGFVSEGAGYSWASLHAAEALGADPATASFAYPVFAAAVTVTRLTADRLRSKTEPAAWIRLTGSIAAAGYAIVLAAPLLPAGRMAAGLVGWSVAAAGLATIVPGVFSVVGTAGANVGRALSGVTTMAYAGQLGGPAVIGPLAGATSLGVAMAVPGLLALAIAVAGPIAIRRATGPARAAPVSAA
ncbi:MFS transporter [Amycolatopsis benzoatilytica]|uniref:MFS transporter n=1 Tax=Amycolatopsis benzoatilytica TaxID=346045 RepID=UPI00037FD4E1|nr:MFS transporter [Amycolatopsis benzoatilytica]